MRTYVHTIQLLNQVMCLNFNIAKFYGCFYLLAEQFESGILNSLFKEWNIFDLLDCGVCKVQTDSIFLLQITTFL